MIEKIKAAGIYVFVIKDAPEQEMYGLDIPDQAKKKPHTGKILTVGSDVPDKNIKKGRKAIFNVGAGFVIEIFGEEITVLSCDKILGVIE